MKLLNLDFERIAHDTFRIAGSKVLYTDPFRVAKPDKPDLVLLSHEHSDHMSLEDLAKVITPKTHIVASPLCRESLQGVKAATIQYLKPGDKTTVEEIEITAVPAYNLNKFRSPGNPFHPKESLGDGFIFKMDGTTVYYAGDTDHIPEMNGFRCDIALLPVSGTYVMTAEEAAQAAADINPRIAVPMHYNAIVGTDADALKFKSLVNNCRVEIV
ncbi:MAG: MBL fold metallo-hydrolase [Terriglobia bacterium]